MKSEEGFSLIEELISLALLGIIGVAFLSGLCATSKALFITDERETAKNLAETQMEYVKGQDYSDSYSAAPIPGEYAGYSAAIFALPVSSRDGNIQRITVIIENQDEEVIRLESSKVK